MSRSALFIVALLLFFSLTLAARPGPVLGSDAVHEIQQVGTDEVDMDVGEGCEGVGEDECLMRRTLVAHTDYIYTQKKKNP
ncbi:hypothetical protein CKAN_00644700 [Cinnamomum micranthum f. kanehirae]|uniref:Phytosulfokine n=1 Tax=Cinnamomum micranthum f. kanehirae TaxID=337451 RepID=A0A443NHD3_9MAGN|nr:hypothetical protein CKAN_00644700 [Cinnamomum micranthum f. kanehirae]